MSHARQGRGAGRAPERPAGFTSCVATIAPETKPQPRDLFNTSFLFPLFLHKLGSAGRGPRVHAARPPLWLREGSPTPGWRVAQRLELLLEAPLHCSPRVGTPKSAHRRSPGPSVPSSERTWRHTERSSRVPPDPERGGVPEPHPVQAGAHDPRGEPAKMAAAQAGPGRDGTPDLPPSARPRSRLRGVPCCSRRARREGTSAPRCTQPSRRNATPRAGAAATRPARGWSCGVSPWSRPRISVHVACAASETGTRVEDPFPGCLS